MATTVREFSVFLENKPGRMAQVCTAISQEKVNITALAVSERKERSVLRLVTEDANKTRLVLRNLNLPFDEHDVLLVEIRNQPGAVAQVCEVLAEEHINIEYTYCSSGVKNGKAIGIFRVSNLPKALKALADNSVRLKRKAHGARGWVNSPRRGPAAPVVE